MRINLNVPFSDKDNAKRAGARWDGIKKCWYIEDKEDLTPFMGWMKESHLKPNNAKHRKPSKG